MRLGRGQARPPPAPLLVSAHLFLLEASRQLPAFEIPHPPWERLVVSQGRRISTFLPSCPPARWVSRASGKRGGGGGGRAKGRQRSGAKLRPDGTAQFSGLSRSDAWGAITGERSGEPQEDSGGTGLGKQRGARLGGWEAKTGNGRFGSDESGRGRGYSAAKRGASPGQTSGPFAFPSDAEPRSC